MRLDDDIHNYYEHLVLEKIEQMGLDSTGDTDYLADLCCLTLNQVPPRYIRYEVDMAFYVSPNERHQMEMNVATALKKAKEFLDKKRQDNKV